MISGSKAAKINFAHFININDLLHAYNAAARKIADINIGYDQKIYILLRSDIPKQSAAHPFYSVLVLSADWESGILIDSQYYELGSYKLNFHFIQPIRDKLLLLGARCCYDSRSGGEKNAWIVDQTGGIYSRFCFGDGIADCIVLSDGKILTSYFDEGVFGNYGWVDPIGKNGLVVWNESGEIIWQAHHDICDCYAMNTDDEENLWFYFYTDFHLVKTDFISETIYKPDIAGANAFALTNDLQHIIFDKGYRNHGKFVCAPITHQKIGRFQPLAFEYQNQKIDCALYRFRSSAVIMLDHQNRMFAKNIISIP